MEEEFTDVDDYVDLIMWVSDAEERKHAIFEFTSCAKVLIPLQVHQTNSSGSHNDCSEQSTLFNN
jgi:hypothetical protein